MFIIIQPLQLLLNFLFPFLLFIKLIHILSDLAKTTNNAIYHHQTQESLKIKRFKAINNSDNTKTGYRLGLLFLRSGDTVGWFFHRSLVNLGIELRFL